MNLYRLLIIPVLCMLIPYAGHTQDTLRLKKEECEAIFLNENLLLIAEKLEVSKSEALLLQASLWPNPTFEVDEVNLWASKKQLNVFGDELQGINGGNFGRNQQISFSVEQLILTAGKRKKLMALEQVGVEKSLKYFEELLRCLKVEFRNSVYDIIYLQVNLDIYNRQIDAVRHLVQVYERQVKQGNIAQDEYVRLKALELEFSKKINDLNKEVFAAQKELKQFMNIPPGVFLVIDDNTLADIDKYKVMTLAAVIDSAKKSRPDLQIAGLEEDYFRHLLRYEKSQKVPNITLKGGYDRGGNFMYNFVGFGIGVDIPVFNRNQGSIRYAEVGMEQSRILYKQKEMTVQNEIILAHQNLMNAIDFYENIDAGYEATLDELLDAYNKNFISRNISLLQYIDFVEAYIDNKNIIIEAGKEVRQKIEELNFAIGKDL